MPDVFFDLSELYLNSGVKFKYYGIARTVMEVAYELTQIDATIRYVIYSPTHRRFFEVFPRTGDASLQGFSIPIFRPPLRRCGFVKTCTIKTYLRIRSTVVCIVLFNTAIKSGGRRFLLAQLKTLISMGMCS